MNYYAARERADHTGWHFTVSNDGQTWPVGYCACHAPHVTKAEAEACYTKFVLDTRLVLQEPRAMQARDTVLGCRECGDLTHRGAVIDDKYIPLCEAHRTRVVVEKYWTAKPFFSS